MLTLFAALIFAWQIIVMALLMSIWRSDTVKARSIDVFGEPDIGFFVVTAIGIAASAPVAWFYTSLFGFHTYLIARKMTTYDYFIEKSKLGREKRAKEKQKEDEVKARKETEKAKTTTPKPLPPVAIDSQPTISHQGSTLTSDVPSNLNKQSSDTAAGSEAVSKDSARPESQLGVA